MSKHPIEVTESRTPIERRTLVSEVATVVNRNSIENASDTPDFILAEYLVVCLEGYEAALKRRKVWFDKA